MPGFMHFENLPLGNSHTHPHPNFPHGHSNKANYLTSHAHIVKIAFITQTHIYTNPVPKTELPCFQVLIVLTKKEA